MFGDNETKLANAYEALRRREYELITDLLEILPRIDSLAQERVAQVRDALFHADHPYLMVFVGPFSSGKSSLINALLGKDDVLAVGPIPTTDRISILRCEACGSRTPIKARKARRPEAAVKEGGTYEVQLTQPGKHGEAKGLYEGYVFIVPKGNVGQKVWARVNKLSGKMAFCELSAKPKDA